MSGATAPKAWPTEPPDVHELIRRRAEQIYYRSGGIPGRDDLNWMQAEREIQGERKAQAKQAADTQNDDDVLSEDAALASHHAVIVKVNGVQYVGEYSPEAAGGYRAGDLKSGEPVPVRFSGDKMFVKRPNGCELETTVVKKVR